MPDAREVLDAAMPEAEWQKQIEDYATMHGWLWYHTRDSRRSPAGFPDLVLVRGETVIFLECKTMKKKPSAAQEVWMARLKGTQSVRAAVVRPSDWDTLEEQLRNLP